MVDNFEQVERRVLAILNGCTKSFSSFVKTVFTDSDTEEKDADRERVEPSPALDGAWQDFQAMGV